MDIWLILVEIWTFYEILKIYADLWTFEDILYFFGHLSTLRTFVNDHDVLNDFFLILDILFKYKDICTHVKCLNVKNELRNVI